MKDTVEAALKDMLDKAFADPPGSNNYTMFWYRVEHPVNQPKVYPYGTIAELASPPSPLDNADEIGEDGNRVTDIDLIAHYAVNLWQKWKDIGGTGEVVEDPLLRDRVYRLLHGGKLPAAPTLVRSMYVIDSLPIKDQDANLIHHAFTVQVTRSLALRA